MLKVSVLLVFRDLLVYVCVRVVCLQPYVASNRTRMSVIKHVDLFETEICPASFRSQTTS